MKLPALTLGIEEEYQIIDPETRKLAPMSEKILAEGEKILRDQIKPEFMRSQVEMGTKICRSIAEARSEVVRLRSTIAGADLYFMNPNGVVFGELAELDVQGSLHVSSADFIELGDGEPNVHDGVVAHHDVRHVRQIDVLHDAVEIDLPGARHPVAGDGDDLAGNP